MKILIVDDEKSVLSGLEFMINAEPDMRVLDIATNGKRALDKISSNRPDLVLIDIQMPVMNGIDCIMRIRELDEQLPILILTTFNETDYIVRGLAHGANGYVIKGLDFSLLIQSIRDVYNNRFVLPSQVAIKLSQYLLQKRDTFPVRNEQDFRFPPGTFSKKEQQMLMLLQTRQPLKEIADSLLLSEGTLRNYLSKLYDKLDVSNRNEAIREIQKFVIR
jgi:DNA-binding NarL/FixJ family response regulator